MSRRGLRLLPILLLLLLFCGCVHYLPREEGSSSGTAQETTTPVGTVVTTVPRPLPSDTTAAEDPPVSEADTGFPNEPESDATKRY